MLACLVAIAPAALAQSERHLGVFSGLQQPSQFGHSVDGVGDLDGDGFHEIISGAPEAAGTQQFGAWVGRMRVIAGRDGRTLFEAEGPHHQARFGWAVRGLGDLDGDGVREFAVGSPQENANGARSGAVHVWSGKTRTKLFTLRGQTGDFLGVCIARGGDIDGDNVEDILTGGHGGATRNQGVVLVWSGKTGRLIKRLVGTSAFDFFGHTVCGGTDLDGDGTPDVVVGIPDEDTAGTNAGQTAAFSGKTWQRLWTVIGERATDNFGHSVCVVGDINGDRVDDIAIGAPQFTPTSLGTGFLYIVSGNDGKRLHRWTGKATGDWFSEPVATIGDWNLDGVPDILVGSSRAAVGSLQQAGRAEILSGRDGSAIQAWSGSSAGSLLGFSAALAGDVNHDGALDLVLGAPGDDSGRGLARTDTKNPPELTIGPNGVSTTKLNRATMHAQIPTKFAGMLYYTMGSVSGRTPPIQLGPVQLPLKADFYTDMLLTAPNTFVQNGFGIVGNDGRLSMNFGLAAGFSTSLAGLRFDHAVLIIDVKNFSFAHATNAVTLHLVQ